MTDFARTRVKICGLTRVEDLEAAVSLGVDAVGLVFSPRSPRHLELDQARLLAARIPAFVTLVALFLDPPADMVASVLDAVQPELLQFHGAESPHFCTAFRRRYIKAIAMAQPQRLAAELATHPDASGFVLDSHAPGERGGTGEVFDWKTMPAGRPGLILAGGLDAANVGGAIRARAPFGVDVSSGVESAPGHKSAARMADFIRAVREADQARNRMSS